MATRKGNGHDPLTVEMVGLLKQLVEEARATRAETNARLDALKTEMSARLDALKTVTENAHRHIHERIDDAHGEAAANTERITTLPDGLVARITRLEEAVFKKTG